MSSEEIQPLPEQNTGSDQQFDKDVDEIHEGGSVEEAAVDAPLSSSPKKGPAAREAERQMGIAKADRQNREDAGLPPRVHDLT